MITLKTNICDLSRKELRILNESLILVCKNIMGKKKDINVKTTLRGTNYYGRYFPDTKTIVLYKSSCVSVERYVSTFIHEYRHSKQKGIVKNYGFCNEMFGYWNNPYEVDAREHEKTLRPEVWKHVKKLYKKNLEPNLIRY
jgi:hypothetical protein